MKQARPAHLSVEKARDQLLVTIPPRFVPGTKTLHRIEAGEVAEEKVNSILIIGLAKVYGCRISDLSPAVAAEHDALEDLLASSLPWTTTRDPDQTSLDDLLTFSAAA